MLEPTISALWRIAVAVFASGLAYVRLEAFHPRDKIRQLAKSVLQEYEDMAESIELFRELNAVKALAYLADDRRYYTLDRSAPPPKWLPWFYRNFILKRYDRAICWTGVSISGGLLVIDGISELGISVGRSLIESANQPLMICLIVLLIAQIVFVYIGHRNKNILTDLIEYHAEDIAVAIRTLVIQSEPTERKQWEL